MISVNNLRFQTVKVFDVILGAAQAAVLFYPINMLANILSWKFDSFFIVMVLTVVSSLLYGASLLSCKRSYTVLKWLLSLPITVVFWYWFAKSDFYLRGLNWIYRGYGNQSAGGNFASFVILLLQTGCCFFTGLFAINFSKERGDDFYYLKNAFCSVVCVIIVLITVILNGIIPHYMTVY